MEVRALSTASAKPAPQMILRRVALWDRQEVEAGVCAECSLSRLLTFYMAYDWEPGVSRELLALCDSCGLDLLTRSKALESQLAAERTALEKVRALREQLDNWVRLFETANPGSPALRYTRQAWKVVRDEIDFRFPELDAQERAGAKA